MDQSNESPINIEVDSTASHKWNIFHWRFPKSEVVFFAQVFLIYVVVITSIVNLTIGSSDSKLWTALLTGHIGYLLPNPSLKRK
jgi:hypothetical protein